MLSPNASGLLAQMRALTDVAKTLLAVTDQLLGDVWMCGKHRILLRIVYGFGVGCERARVSTLDGVCGRQPTTSA
jgi:hypothetical protein